MRYAPTTIAIIAIVASIIVLDGTQLRTRCFDGQSTSN
jgi:hypothetical protein